MRASNWVKATQYSDIVPFWGSKSPIFQIDFIFSRCIYPRCICTANMKALTSRFCWYHSNVKILNNKYFIKQKKTAETNIGTIPSQTVPWRWTPTISDVQWLHLMGLTNDLMANWCLRGTCRNELGGGGGGGRVSFKTTGSCNIIQVKVSWLRWHLAYVFIEIILHIFVFY